MEPAVAKKELVEEKNALPDMKDVPEAPPLPPLPTAPPPSTPAGEDKWADLKQMKGDATGNYDDLKKEIEREKNGQIALDPAAFQSDALASASPVSAPVIDSLNDPTPWVRAQAARRLSSIHPAPVQTIPTLIQMLDDKDVECRRAAAGALGTFGPLAHDAIPALNHALSDPDKDVSLIAADALKAIQQH
jgi:HEAT repeat protein